MTEIFRFVVLKPVAGTGKSYLSEPLALDSADDLQEVERDTRLAAGTPPNYSFTASEAFPTDETCKHAIISKNLELARNGYRVERISVYDNEIL